MYLLNCANCEEYCLAAVMVYSESIIKQGPTLIFNVHPVMWYKATKKQLFAANKTLLILMIISQINQLTFFNQTLSGSTKKLEVFQLLEILC